LGRHRREGLEFVVDQFETIRIALGKARPKKQPGSFRERALGDGQDGERRCGTAEGVRGVWISKEKKAEENEPEGRADRAEKAIFRPNRARFPAPESGAELSAAGLSQGAEAGFLAAESGPHVPEDFEFPPAGVAESKMIRQFFAGRGRRLIQKEPDEFFFSWTALSVRIGRAFLHGPP
jgi:hypothetical protein